MGDEAAGQPAPATPQAAPSSGLFPPASATPPAAAPAPGQPAPAGGDHQIGERFDALNSREHDLVQRERVTKQRQADLIAIDKIKQGIANGTLDPNDMVSLFQTGDVPNLLTQFVPADKRNQPATTEDKINSIEEMILQDRQTREQEQFDRNREGWKSELTSVLSAASEQYPYINGLKAHGLVFDEWERLAGESDTPPDWQQVARNVEDQLIAQGTSWGTFLGQGNPARQPPQPPAQPAQQQRTLSNQMTPTSGHGAQNLNEMTDDQARAAAAEMLVFK